MIKKNVIMRRVVSVFLAVVMIISLINFHELEKNAKAADYGVRSPRIADDGTVTWDKIQFGSYKQSPIFEKQPIKWRILSVNEDESEAFVIADKGIDYKEYNKDESGQSSEDYSCTWETCSLRKWLNNEFINEAFTLDEQAIINDVTVKNEDSTGVDEDGEEWITDGGNDTKDKIYLLSISEAGKKEYGFESVFEEISNTRCVKTTDYASMKGADRSCEYDIAENGYWLLRSPGCDSRHVAYVDYRGNGDSFGLMVYNGIWTNAGSLRPVLHVNLNSAHVKDAGEVYSDGHVTALNNGYNNPIINNGITTWDCIYFGMYKQDIIEKEPIEWKVLSVSGDDALIVSEKGLDCKPFINSREYDNIFDVKNISWENCVLRKWLNNDFYYEAFDPNEQAAIKEVFVSNEGNKLYDTEEGNNTTDKVYLLSLSEATNQEYGFDVNPMEKSETRCVNTTEYAKYNGVYCWNIDDNICAWWMRSLKYGCPIGFDHDGIVEMRPESSVETAICPVIHINLSSDVWKNVGTVSAKLTNYVPNYKNNSSTSNTVNNTPYQITKPVAEADNTNGAQNILYQPVDSTLGAVTVKKAVKISKVNCKKNTKKITGKVSVSKATVKIKVGKKKYIKANVKGKKFTLKLSYKLKKKTKIIIKVSKKNYNSIKKTFYV